jgi:hypothetical protein
MIANLAHLALGLLAGLVHFTLLRRNTALYLQAGGAARAVGLQVARLGLLAGLLVEAATQGAMPLLLAMLGVLIARPIALRRMAALP